MTGEVGEMWRSRRTGTGDALDPLELICTYIYIYMYLDHTDSYLGSPLLLFLGSMYSWLDFFVDL